MYSYNKTYLIIKKDPYLSYKDTDLIHITQRILIKMDFIYIIIKFIIRTHVFIIQELT